MCNDTGKANQENVIRVGKAAAPPFLQVIALQRWTLNAPNPSMSHQHLPVLSHGDSGCSVSPSMHFPLLGGKTWGLFPFFHFSPSHSCSFSPISHHCFACAIILNKCHAFAIKTPLWHFPLLWCQFQNVGPNASATSYICYFSYLEILLHSLWIFCSLPRHPFPQLNKF